jgi:DGQHR domain-containing protein
VVVVEETTHKTSNIVDHLRKKAELFAHLSEHAPKVVPYLAATFAGLQAYFDTHQEIDPRQCILRYVYVSRNDVEEPHRIRYGKTCSILEHGPLQYFLRLSRTIRRSARFELFKFLGLGLSDIIGPARREVHEYRALLLPEVPSGFPPGHRLVSFLIDPRTLIERAYVLRSDSWRDSEALYQRLLVKGKIASMRDYLVGEKRVFVNNIIATLPHETEFTKDELAAGERRGEDEITTGMLSIPRQFNTIGIIDGQHRVFAYHEGNDKHEPRIAILRDRQHLLVTGIIYPQGTARNKAHQFEAKLFLEINDKQKRVRGDLKQSIERIVNPYSSIAIAKAVIERLASKGPLSGMLEVHFFDVGKIKTASIVSYGLRHIVDVGATASLFKLWRGPGKTGVKDATDKDALDAYIGYSASQLEMLIAGFKENVDEKLWTPDRKVSRALSATTINGLVFCMRHLIENKKVGASFEYYKNAFKAMTIRFEPGRFTYKSSHWRDLGDALYSSCF